MAAAHLSRLTIIGKIHSRPRSRRPSLRRQRMPRLLSWQLCSQVPTPQFKRGAGGGTGVGLIEVYDVDPLAASRLTNISTRGLVQTGNNALIGGCSLTGGSGSNEVVIRALGPSLVPLGVNNALPDPVVTLYDSNGNVITANDNWKDSQQSAIAKHWPPAAKRFRRSDLSHVTGRQLYCDCHWQNGSTGVGLVEVYATQ